MMIKLCLITVILGVASAGLMFNSNNEYKYCPVNLALYFPKGESSRYNCSQQYIKEDKSDPRLAYCADPSCKTGWQNFYEDSQTLYCCQEKCQTFDCNGAFKKDKTCKTNHEDTNQKAYTVDYGETWQCFEKFTPKCLGGNIRECYASERSKSPNSTLQLFGQEFCCSSWGCDLRKGIMVLDKDSWSWSCVNKDTCSFGDFKMKHVPKSELFQWECISETCPQNKTKFDNRRERYYCEANVDCISDFLQWNDRIKNWECPSVSGDKKSTIEYKLEELISRINSLDQKANNIDQKVNNVNQKVITMDQKIDLLKRY